MYCYKEELLTLFRQSDIGVTVIKKKKNNKKKEQRTIQTAYFIGLPVFGILSSC